MMRSEPKARGGLINAAAVLPAGHSVVHTGGATLADDCTQSEEAGWRGVQ